MITVIVKMLFTLDIDVDEMRTIMKKVHSKFHQSSREFTILSTMLETKNRLLERTIGKRATANGDRISVWNILDQLLKRLDGLDSQESSLSGTQFHELK